MNKIIKNTFMLFVILVLVLFNFQFSLGVEKYERIEIILLNQDPYPAQPKDYVTLLFKIENVGGIDLNDVLIELLPQYPFSLDAGNSAIKEIKTLTLREYGEKAVFIKYKLRVDKDAIDGENEIKIRYVYNTGGKWDNYITKEFNVTIENPTTDFDVAIQDYSPITKTLSIAISNIGKKNANSVSIEIPEQSTVEIIGSNKEIVGNIEAGDYTIASFKILPKEEAPLIIKIFYTDSIGIRRETEKVVFFKPSAYFDNGSIKSSSIKNRPIIYIATGIIGIIVIFVLFAFLKKRGKKNEI